MGAYDGIPRSEIPYSGETRSQWNSQMENGIGHLVDNFSGLDVNGTSKESLFQVMKAVEFAETTIRQQVEENNRLKTELQKRTHELEKYKSDDSTALRSHSNVLVDERILGPYKEHQSVSSVGNKKESARWMGNSLLPDPQGALVLHQNVMPKNEDFASQPHAESQHYSEENHAHGSSKVLPSVRGAADNAGFSQFSSPSSRSVSPSGYQREGEYDPKFNLSGHGLMPTSEINNQSSSWKQDLVLKVREHEEEILQLQKQLSNSSMKEAQIRNEKYVLEKRIAYMRMAFDQQQQELVEATSKALSYRQDIIEENIRLTYALQVAQQERSTFVSSLLPLLAEYSLQPSVPDAQSIVNNLRALFKHLQEKLFVTEEKLKESQYQLAPWRSDAMNHPSFIPQSPAHSIGAALTNLNKNGLELVPQSYSYGQIPISSPSNAQTTTGWDPLGHHTHHTALAGVAAKNLESDNFGRSSPSPNRNAQDVPARSVTHGDSHAKRFNEETSGSHLPFNDPFSGNELGDSEAVGHQNGREPSVHGGSGNPSFLNPSRDDPNSSFSPYLPPVLEEPSSSFSEATEEDPLPAIEGLQVTGEAFPGRVLEACGYSINGTTSCNFEWVRYLEDGSVNYIEGAKQPRYLVTADDVDSYLAIQVQPLDNRRRKGELVKVFANEQRKIPCDPDIQEQIEKTLYSGHASYELSLATGYLDFCEPSILAIKKEGFSIKCKGSRGVVVTEKFLPSTDVRIPYGQPTTFAILSSSGVEHHLRTNDDSLLRDTIVLTMRMFIKRAVEKRKGKKKGLFF